MRFFLCLFARYRALQAQIAEAGSARISAEDNARYWKTRAESAEGERDKANGVVSHCLKQVANFEALRSGSTIVPFPEAYPQPPQTFPDGAQEQQGPPVGHRRLAREVQTESIERTRRAAMELRRTPLAESQAS